MDEEEELENTLIGQEEAPDVNTEGVLIGSIPSNNVVSFVNTTGQQSDVMTQLADTASANVGVPMTGMRPIDPATGQPRSEEFLQRAEDAGVTNFLAQASVPLPQTSPDLYGSTTARTTVFLDRNQNGVDDRDEGLVSERNPMQMKNDFLDALGIDRSSDFGTGKIRVFGEMVDATPTTTLFPTPDPLVLPSETIGQVPSANPFSLESAKQVNAMMRPLTQDQLNAIPAPLPEGVQRGSPQANFLNTLRGSGNNLTEQQISQFRQQAQDMGTTFDPVTGFSRDPFLNREASRTRTSLPGQTAAQFLRNEDALEQRTEQFVDPQGRLRRRLTPQASALQEFDPGVQPLAPEYSNFARESLAREARLAERDRLPGETQTERDTRIAQSRTQGSRLGGELSQADLRDLAQGSATGATEGERLRALQIQQRAGLGEFKPDMTPLEVDAEKALIARRKAETAESEATLVDADRFNTSISNSTSAAGVVDYNKALDEYVRGGGNNRSYLEFLRKGQELAKEAIDAGRKPEIKVIQIGGFNVLTQDGKFMTATTIGGGEVSTSAIRTIEGKIQLIEDAEKDYFSGDPERIKRAERTITALDIKNNEFGGQSTAKDYFGFGALTGNDYDAYNFAINNPNDPRSKEMLERLRKEAEDAEN